MARNEAESSAEIERIPEPHRERLNAYGREWERLLFAAGIRSGYSLCYARASLSVSEVGDFFRWLAQRLESNERPDGYVLFFESDGKDPIVGSEWRCVFYFMLRSDYAPERVALENGAPSLSIDELGRIA